MGEDLQWEDILSRIREKLTKDKVKLWLPPYCTEEGNTCEEEIQNLSQSYAEFLKLDDATTKGALKCLQTNAQEKLKARSKFQETGVATIKVRVPSNECSGGNSVNMEIKLTAMGHELRERVGKQVGVIPERVKLICRGRILKDNLELQNQGLGNGIQIMAVILHDNPAELKEYESRYRLLESTREDAKLLASRTNNVHDYSLQIADQSGRPLELPKEEKEALVIAMALHEKGRAALKREDHSLALVLFLEADKEFSRCNSQLLTSVDNYALLNLDIVWCYLCLRSINHIPDAEQRLKTCEKNFVRSYGPNLERVIELKGTTGNEAALLLRLHILQAVVLYHCNKRVEAAELIKKAEEELASLKVDDETLTQVVALGYSPAEARVALRATQGNIPLAVDMIQRKREEKLEMHKKESEERLKKKLGKCVNGEWVEGAFHKMLLSMGYSSAAARAALQQSNNNMTQAVQLIQDNPELLKIITNPRGQKRKESIEQMISLGFDEQMAKLALKKHKGNAEKAIEDLANNNGVVILDPSSQGASTSQGTQSVADFAAAAAAIIDLDCDDDSDSEHQKEQDKQAYERLAEGISTFEEDHLDLTLIPEEQFVMEYKQLLRSLLE